jgi:phosphohistidine phosphatase
LVFIILAHMLKQLVLMRHAKSDWSVPGQKDFDRELNSRGHRDAPRMGARIKSEKLFLPQLVVCSPAERAKMTAQYVCEQIGYEFDSIVFDQDVYEASIRTLLRIVNELEDAVDRVMLFGHNPGFSYFSEFLTKKEVGEMPTASAICISFEVDSWAMVSEGTGIQSWYLYPKDGE